MPKWKYFANLFLTAVANATFYVFLSEYHSGLRAYTGATSRASTSTANSDDFVFDTEIIAQGVGTGLRIREIPIQTRYFDEASQIGFWRSVRYGLAILRVLIGLQAAQEGDPAFPPLPPSPYQLKDFAGSSHRILAGWLSDLPHAIRILELGPGPGHIARLVNRAELEWWGIERELGHLGSLRSILRQVLCADLEVLDELPRGFDVAITADLIEHLCDPSRTLRAIHRGLQPKGLLLVSVPNVANVAMRLQLLFGIWNYADRGILDRTHRVFFTRRSLREALSSAGFEVVRESASMIPLQLAFPRCPRGILQLLSWPLLGATRLLPKLFGYQLLVAARKR